jgi:hypothetical protein
MGQGTPDAVIRAINSRKEEKANEKSDPFGEIKPLPPFYQPSSSSATPRAGASSTPSKPRTPSLVAAAQASSQDSESSDFVSRLATQFRGVSRSTILDIYRKYPNDRAKVTNTVRTMSRDALHAPSTTHVPLSPAPPPSLHVPVPKAHPSPVKPNKDQSAIYGKRGKGGKKRGSESESEGQMSEAESEMDWSDDGGPKKKKRKNDVMRPEEVTFKAFNEISAEELTGTICEFILLDDPYAVLIFSVFCRTSCYHHQE